MTDKLPHTLLALFQPRPTLRYLPPHDFPPEARASNYIDGVAAFMPSLAVKKEADKDVPYTESPLEQLDREKLEKQARQKWLMTEGYKQQYQPDKDPQARGDAYKTLFVGRLSYDTTAKDLEREFSRFGPIEDARIITDKGENSKKKGQSRGYAFVIFKDDRDMKAAYKDCESLSINGRRVLVDVERGRTVKGWRPRRFGGGLGGRHYTKGPQRPAGLYGQPPGGPGFGGRGGGFRGGHDRFDRGGGFRGGRGGFRGGGGGGFGGNRSGFANGGAPNGAPAGPRQGGFGGGRSNNTDDRGRSNANFEPLPSRAGGYRDRDRDMDSDRGQKRSYEGSYDESRQRRRY